MCSEQKSRVITKSNHLTVMRDDPRTCIGVSKNSQVDIFLSEL